MDIIIFLIGIFLGILVRPIIKLGNKIVEDCIGKKRWTRKQEKI